MIEWAGKKRGPRLGQAVRELADLLHGRLLSQR